jgi:arylsulfatase A-like enzyme
LANVSDEVPADIDGISFLPALYGKTNKEHPFMYWEDADYERTPPFGEITSTLKQAVLQGDWKAVKNSPDSPVELYNLASDIGEQNNVAAEHPELVKELEKLMKSQHVPAPPQVDITAAEAKKLYVPEESCDEK